LDASRSEASNSLRMTTPSRFSPRNSLPLGYILSRHELHFS
jgi:hypothetical protein